jgi:hypothetical protein
MPESSHRVTIVVAVIGLIGALGGALIGNWDKIFPSSSNIDPPAPEIRGALLDSDHPSSSNIDPPVPEIRGVWRDSNYPSNSSQITQNGNNFQFTRQGVLPNGIAFESSGNGTMTGQLFTSHYNAQYQSGAISAGDCSGTVSPDGMRMELNCRDSLLGPFPSAAIRQ